jgi:hypothetical protein
MADPWPGMKRNFLAGASFNRKNAAVVMMCSTTAAVGLGIFSAWIHRQTLNSSPR